MLKEGEERPAVGVKKINICYTKQKYKLAMETQCTARANKFVHKGKTQVDAKERY